jgi:hypothetical protein
MFLNPNLGLERSIKLMTLKTLPTPEEKLALVKTIIPFVLSELRYLIWTIIGFFTVNWLFFLVLFLMGYIKTHLFKLAKDDNDKKQIYRADAIGSTILIISILIKHFFNV